MQKHQIRKPATPARRAGTRALASPEFQLLSASRPVLPGANQLSLAGLAARVAGADADAGRTGFKLETTEIVQIRPAAAGLTYFASYTPGREKRPHHPVSCPLCLRRVRRSGQNYATIRLRDWELTILANPFSYAPECITWATHEHLPQACGLADEPNSWQSVFHLMLALCPLLGEHVVGFNELAGNSLDHLHLVSHRPARGLGLYAVQQCAARLSAAERRSVAMLGNRHGYPIELWRVGLADPVAAAKAGASLVAGWRAAGGPEATANCTCALEDGRPVLYLFPRCRLLRPQGWRSSPAFMELSGVFIAADRDEMAHVRSGHFDHAHFTRILSSLRPPLLGSSDTLTHPSRGTC
jgi:hypothetical protein